MNPTAQVAGHDRPADGPDRGLRHRALASPPANPDGIQGGGLRFALLPILILASYVVEALFGLRCPGCGRWTLRRLVSCPSYFSCSGCGMRYKRFGSAPGSMPPDPKTTRGFPASPGPGNGRASRSRRTR